MLTPLVSTACGQVTVTASPLRAGAQLLQPVIRLRSKASGVRRYGVAVRTQSADRPESISCTRNGDDAGDAGPA